MNLSGMKIITNFELDSQPVLRVNPRFAELMPAGYGADLQDWMTKRFGMTEPKIYACPQQGVIYMGVRAHQKLMQGMAA